MRRALLVPLLALPLLASCGDGGDPAVRAGIAETPVAGSDSSPAEPTGAEPTAGEPTGQPAGTAVAVYWLRDVERLGPRLYREFVRLPHSDEPVRQAVEAMLAGQPADPDYVSLWPEGVEVLEARVEGDIAFVDLSEAALRGSAGAEFEALSAQQLVHTVTAAAPQARSVRLLVAGEPVETLWGHVDVSRPVPRSPAATTLAPVWVVEPREGGTVATGAQVTGTASVFEATVTWEWRRGDDVDQVVAAGFSTASEGGPGRGEWSAPVEVPPGEYVFRAFEESAQDGTATFVDDKRVTVVER